MNLEIIQNELLAGQNSPHKLVEYKVWLAGHYSYLVGLQEKILARRPLIWNDLRQTVKSDKACDRAYESTQDGVDLMHIMLEEKRCEKMTSAINSLLRNAEQEARNLY